MLERGIEGVALAVRPAHALPTEDHTTAEPAPLCRIGMSTGVMDGVIELDKTTRNSTDSYDTISGQYPTAASPRPPALDPLLKMGARLSPQERTAPAG